MVYIYSGHRLSRIQALTASHLFLFNGAKGIASKMIDDMIALQTDLTLRNKLTSSLDFWSSDNTDNRDNTEAGTEIERNTTSD